jgi:hypothetical protein
MRRNDHNRNQLLTLLRHLPRDIRELFDDVQETLVVWESSLLNVL